MNTPKAGTDEPLFRIAQLCDAASFHSEGGRNFIFMEGLRILVNGACQKLDALLCLNHNNPSYPTKLYLSAQLGMGLNWNETAYILARNWHTFSWRDVRGDMPYHEILAAHLAPLQGKVA